MNDRRVEPARAQVEGRVPGMVEPGRVGEPVLADDLEPLMQGLTRLLPRFVGDFGPSMLHER